MGGHQIHSQGPNDDGYDEDGYDESQRAEILEATRDGPGDGTILTDLAPDLGDDPDDELEMLDGETGEVDDSIDEDADDIAEDEIQAELDEDSIDADTSLDDADEAALKP